MPRKERLVFGKPIEPPKAPKWEPRKGETRVFRLLRITKGDYGIGYLVEDLDAKESMFLPKHSYLLRLLEAAEIAEGYIFQVKCLKIGKERKGKEKGIPFEYELRLAKGNPPF